MKKISKTFYEYLTFCFSPLGRLNKKEKNGIKGALEIENKNNFLTVAFPPLGNRAFGFSTDFCATVMLQTMRAFINKNSNSLLKIIRAVVNNIWQVKTFTRIMMANNCEIICEEEFKIFCSFILLNI